MLPFLSRYITIPIWFQQDNAPIHVSRSTKEWFKQNNINVMDWSACYPDCNPIENLWGVIVLSLYAECRQFDSVDQLKTAIIDAWGGIKDGVIEKLVDSMPDRMFQVINKNGSAINY